MSISAGLLIQEFTPQTVTLADNGQGGQTESWADGTAFRGRLSALSSDERLSADKQSVFASHKIYCDYQSSLSETQRIRNSDSTRYFQVKGITNPSNANHHLEITVLELD